MTAATASPETIAAAADMVAPADVGAETRHARALAALRSAEERTGVRKQATAARPVPTKVARPVQTIPAPAAATSPGHAPTERSREMSREPSHESSREPSRDPLRERSRGQVRALRGGFAAEPRGGFATGSGGASVGGPASSPSSRAGAVGADVARAGAGQPGEGARVLPVHPRLAALLPDGGLRAGTTVVVRGSTSLLLTLLAEASRDGAWTVLVGYPAAGMAAAADAGCDLARTLVVPLPAGSGVDAPAVLAALIDGMDVVVVGPDVALLDHDRRRLTARARDRSSVLISATPAPSLSAGYSPLRGSSAGRISSTQRGDGGWGGAHVVLEATAGTWTGIDDGTGWLRRRTLRVRRTGRGNAARPLDVEVEVPVYRAVADADLGGAQGSLVEDGAVPGDTGRRVGQAGAPDGASGDLPRLELVG